MIKLSKSISGLLNTEKFSPIFIGGLENKWEKVVGKKISEATKIIKVKNNTIYIKCKNPSWKNELQYQKEEILKKINKHTNKIKNIVLI